MKKIVFLVFCMLLSSATLYATHNRAGEITYRQISEYTYEITLVTYTYTPSFANETRDVLPIDWGDGTMSNIPRIAVENLPDNYTKNTYRTIHTFPGPGTFKIVMEDPNRNEGVSNIFDSVNIPFSISTTLRIDAILGANSTPVLLNPPVDKAALGQRFVHNPAAYDPDGDSLSYALAVCTGQNGMPIPNYEFPEATLAFYVDSLSGDLVWDAPTAKGIFNVAMVVQEWRKGVLIGQVVRDIQIEVFESDNTTPTFEEIRPICLRAGDTVRFTVTATDADGDYITLTASGGPLDMVTNKALFSSSAGKSVVEGDFEWVPTCEEVREQPYTVLFKATDSGKDVALAGFTYAYIQVIGHPPTIDSLAYAEQAITSRWAAPLCENAHTLELYRAVKPVPYVPEYCEWGLPPHILANYELIAESEGNITRYIDANAGAGITPGFEYCYRMIAKYAQDFPSYVSPETCITVAPIAHVVTNVSVLTTDANYGKVNVAWSVPRNFDTILYPQPYSYKIFRMYGSPAAPAELVATVHGLYDTTYLDSLCNTLDSILYYRVELYSDYNSEQQLVEKSSFNSSPRLYMQEGNKEVCLQVFAQVGWHNDSLYIYRKLSQDSVFELIASVMYNSYCDTHVINMQQYDYYVRTSGYFNSPLLPQRVYNYSQIASATPIDTTPPEPQRIEITQNCEQLTRTITWYVSENTDAEQVIIYYKNCLSDSLHKLVVLTPAEPLYYHTIADTATQMEGCYFTEAIDFDGNTTGTLRDTCFYTCPMYELPNIFTPNADGENEVYKPVVNRFVQYVDMQIFDSWGNLVFVTSNPKILWDGTHYKTHKKLSDGVFYYICDIYEYWYDCTINPRTKVGFIHMFSDGKIPNANE